MRGSWFRRGRSRSRQVRVRGRAPETWRATPKHRRRRRGFSYRNADTLVRALADEFTSADRSVRVTSAAERHLRTYDESDRFGVEAVDHEVREGVARNV